MATVPHGKATRKISYPPEIPAAPYCGVAWRELGWDAPYPTTDGKPMGESPLHARILFMTWQALEPYVAAHDPNAFVGCNTVIYYVHGDTSKYVVPDIFVSLGAGNHERDSYLLWQEKAPELVIEVTSKSTRRRDEKVKFQLYQDELKVREYFLFDPKSRLKPPLQGYRRIDGTYQPIAPVDGRLPSEVLGLHLERHGRELRLYDPAAQRWLPTHDEEISERDTALQDAQAEIERLRQEIERLREPGDRSR